MRKKTAATVDANWTSIDAILDTWAQTLDALKNSPPGTTARATRIDFGGMFGIGERTFNNPLISGPGLSRGIHTVRIQRDAHRRRRAGG